MGLALEEEQVRRAGGEEGEDIRNGNFQEDHVHDLAILQPSYPQPSEDAMGVPGSEAKVEKEEGRETRNGSESRCDDEKDGEDPALRALGWRGMVIPYGDQGAIVDKRDDHEEDDGEGEEARPLFRIGRVVVSRVRSRIEREHGDEEERQQL